jgi:hypothetical protein
MPKVDDTYEDEMICTRFCGQCPSYPEVKGELLFCAKGRSKAPKAKAGCKCGFCDVWNRYDLEGFYYCISGAHAQAE